jgi:hypothetical protein
LSCRTGALRGRRSLRDGYWASRGDCEDLWQPVGDVDVGELGGGAVALLVGADAVEQDEVGAEDDLGFALDLGGVGAGLFEGGEFELEGVLEGAEVGEAGVAAAGDEHLADVAAHDPFDGVSLLEFGEEREGGEVVAVVGDLDAARVEEVAGVEELGVAVVEGEAVFVGAGGGEDVEDATAEVDGLGGCGGDGGVGAVRKLGEALILGFVFGGGEDDGQGDGGAVAGLAPAEDEGVDDGAERIEGGFGGGSGVDEEGTVVAEEEVGEGGFPVDGRVLSEDEGVVVVREDLDAWVFVGGGADAAVDPAEGDVAGGGAGGGVDVLNGGGGMEGEDGVGIAGSGWVVGGVGIAVGVVVGDGDGRGGGVAGLGDGGGRLLGHAGPLCWESGAG